MSATEQMATLVGERVRAESRVGEVEAEQRKASATLAATREAVAEFHRQGGGRPAERDRLEQALAKAKAEVDAPWAERIDGARRAARDARAVVQRFVAENLGELVEARQANGQAAAERINTACSEMLAGYQEWSAVANEISALLSMVAPVRPGDVSFTRCEALAAEATRLLHEGGERAPVVRHMPGEPRFGQLAEASSAA
jgi:hypothetical protein